MRFSSISISNYRQYKDLKLEFNHGDHDLHVIIGENGTGKTNLLNAFTWCLYGVEPHLGMDDKRRGEPKLNKDAIQETLASNSDNATIEVTIELELDKEVNRITRRLPVIVRSKTDILERTANQTFQVQRIYLDGNPDVLRSEAAERHVSRWLPEGIREYFFFDGEQLSNYFSETRSSAIRAAIHSISQIDIVTRMRERTQNTVRVLKRGVGKTQPNIKRINDNIESCEENKAKLEEIIASNERQVGLARKRIAELDETLRGIPDIAKLEAQRDALRKNKKEFEDDVKNTREEYVRFARDAYIDFVFYEVVRDVLVTISRMEREQQLPPSIDRSYLEEMLRDNICKVCGRPLSEDDQTHLAELLDRYRVSNETSHILVSMRSELRSLEARVRDYSSRRDSVLARLRRARSNLSSVTDQLDEIDRTILGNPDAEKIKAWYQERNKLQDDAERYRELIGQRRQQLKNCDALIDKYTKELNAALASQSKQREQVNAIEFGNRAAQILQAVEQDVVTEVRTLMSARTELLFKGLVWKGSKCDHIELGDSYQLALYDKTGYSCAATCSAAERALLALSFTLAMHEVSGFESPLFIDTPIARASGENRANFADTLAEVSKEKQLILTFTPDEYSEAISTVFSPIAASYMHLVLDEAEQIVTVRS